MHLADSDFKGVDINIYTFYFLKIPQDITMMQF